MNKLLVIVLATLIFCSCTETEERNKRLSNKRHIIEREIHNNMTQLRNLEDEKESSKSDTNNLISKKESLKSDIDNLISEKESLKSDINNLISEKESLKSDIDNLISEKESLKSEKSNESIKYMICIKIHQKTFTINIFESAKNKMNDVIIWFETSESYYKNCKIGDILCNSFKSGSFWVDGDISHLEITIKDKKYLYNESD